MKLLTVFSILCAMVTITMAAALPDKEGSNKTEGFIASAEHHVVKRATSCPVGWTKYSNRCFYYVSFPLTWAMAQKVCEHENAHLASVHSLGEYRMIQRLIFDATYQSGLTWIGGSDAQQNGFWFWIDGTHFSYTKWCSGEPNNLWLVEQCLGMNYSENKCMNDLRCYRHLPSVCVKKI